MSNESENIVSPQMKKNEQKIIKNLERNSTNTENPIAEILSENQNSIKIENVNKNVIKTMEEDATTSTTNKPINTNTVKKSHFYFSRRV